MLGGGFDLGSAARMFRMEGHGVNGSTSVSKTESLGSNPSAPAKPSAHDHVFDFGVVGREGCWYGERALCLPPCFCQMTRSQAME